MAVFFVVFGNMLGNVGVFELVGIVTIVVTNFLFYFLMKAPTKAGARLLSKIEGFKQYLSVAEVERLGVLHPPEVTPEVLEKYLPYALALDVEHAWSEKFSQHLALAGVSADDYSPGWYTGSGGWSSGNGVTGLTDTLGGSLSDAISSSSVAPDSCSGLGGGGFSGGGGGGGGW